ncbi:hypothetical protein [Ideonella sp.]|uniref:DUF7931 domain-containing protein n=1 Tax=Ideonella sp. TaxID=1929293 RepID=UPI0035B4192A
MPAESADPHPTPSTTPSADALRLAVPARALGTRADFQAAVRDTLVHAAPAGVRELWWVANDWTPWPLDEPAVLDGLTAWARRPGAHLHWLSHDFEVLRRAMPRLVRWRQTFSHVIDCRQPDHLPTADMPILLVADRRLVIRVLDAERTRGWVSHDRVDIQRAHEQIDAISQRSSGAFAAVTLGL